MNLAALNEQRSLTPELVAQGWASRSRRPLLPEDGKLVIIAADHGARGALGVRGDAKAMASRSDLLHRLTVSLSRPGVDGVLAPRTCWRTSSCSVSWRTRSPSGR